MTKYHLSDEIKIERRGVPCGFIESRVDQGYVLENGVVILESEKDADGNYQGGVGMDGMYLKTSRLYRAAYDDNSLIRAFREIIF